MSSSTGFQAASGLHLHSGRVLGGRAALPQMVETFRMWHVAVRERRLGMMRARMAENCVFHSPTVARPFHGPQALEIVLESVSEVFGESLQYHRQWISDDGRDWALEFTAEVGQKRMRIKGLDLITLDASGCIVKFEVAVRPYRGVGILKKEMGLIVPAKMAALAQRQAQRRDSKL